MCKRIREDIAAVRQRDPAARSGFEILLMYAGVHALFWHRPAHWLYRHHCFFLARLVSQLTRFFTGIEIHPGAVIGHNVFIDHGSGIVIGESTSNIKLKLENDILYFFTGDEDSVSTENAIAYFSAGKLYVNTVQILTGMRIGPFAWMPESDNLNFKLTE